MTNPTSKEHDVSESRVVKALEMLRPNSPASLKLTVDALVIARANDEVVKAARKYIDSEECYCADYIAAKKWPCHWCVTKELVRQLDEVSKK